MFSRAPQIARASVWCSEAEDVFTAWEVRVERSIGGLFLTIELL